MQASGLNVVCRGSTTLLELSRPAKRNALDIPTLVGIEQFFTEPPEGTRVIIVHGAGKNFCAGADLSAGPDGSTSDSIRYTRYWHRAFERIENSEVPVIVVLHGAVVGGGLELAAAAHIRVAERSAHYALPEGALGIFVGGGGAVRIPRLIGVPRMVDMMLTGRSFNADEGLSLGLSQYLVDDGLGVAKATELADRIAANTSLSNFAVVRALPRIARADPDAGLLMETLMVALTIGDPEAKERIGAFLARKASKDQVRR